MENENQNFTVASFFSGCGGFDYGFHKEKFELLFGNDFWKDAAKSFKANYPKSHFFEKPIQDITKNELDTVLNGKKVDIFIGGPPCQCFTRLNNNHLIKLDENKKEDERRQLSSEYIKKVKLLKPRIVLMENVKDMLVRKNKNGELYEKIITDEFKRINYKSYYKIIEMDKYGVPQKRKRVIFLATNDKKLIKFFDENPEKIFPEEINTEVTVAQALSQIKEETKLKNHEFPVNDEDTLLKIKHIPQGGYYEHLPDELKTRKTRGGKEVIVKRYGSYFRRLHPDKPSTTITNNYIIHPNKDRYLSNREKALIHSFPINYKFEGSEGSISQQIANAVPPKFSLIMAKHLKELLINYSIR